MKKAKLSGKKWFGVHYFLMMMAILYISWISDAQGKQPVFTPQQTVRAEVVDITEIAEKYNLIFVGERRFRVSTTAGILDRNGKRIPLHFLPVPVRATLTYQLFGENRDPLVIKIQVR